MPDDTAAEFRWYDAGEHRHHRILLPRIRHLLPDPASHPRLLDLGCGNGWLSEQYRRLGFDVTGCDPSSEGVAIAADAYPGVRFHRASAYDDLLAAIGSTDPFDVIVSSEVIEHLMMPMRMLGRVRAALRPDGVAILTTPYHGYLKNLAIGLLDGWDRHFSVAHEGGHVKFFSRRSLQAMMLAAGFERPRFRGAGRLPYLWMSMVMAASRPHH